MPAATGLPLTAFLLRPGATPVSAWTAAASADVALYSWSGDHAEPLGDDVTGAVDSARAGDMFIAVLRRSSPAPAWQAFIGNALGLDSFEADQQALGAVVFCAVSPGGRWVAWAFGTGSRSLRRSALDPRFGLLVVLNQLVSGQQPDAGRRSRGPGLRELRYRSTAPYVQQTGHRAARDIPVEGFRVDRASDLISAVAGTSADPALTASALFGGRSLRFRADLTGLDELASLAATAAELARAPGYQEAFSWIDNIRPVDDPVLTDELRHQLASELIARPDRPTIDVILPDDLIPAGEDRSIRYIVFPRERGTGPGRTALTAAALAELLERQARTGDAASGLDAELRFLDESADRIGTASVLDCLSATLTRRADEFIAYDGDFYRVSRSFVARIDQEAGRIPATSIVFPRYDGETEPAYNHMVGLDHPQEFVELDRAIIRLPGETGIEASDLVAASGALIHVKRKGKSSVLSHLFLQAANSCELLRRSAEARRQLAELIIERALDDRIVTSIEAAHRADEEDRGQTEVVFAFLGDWTGRSITSLPLFSKISLIAESRRVANLGFRPTVATISAE